MNTRAIESAACVALLMIAALVQQGCGAGGKAIVTDGVNTGDPCSVCKSPHAQGPEAGDLNNGDFTVFCNSRKCKPDGAEDAAQKVADSSAEIHETDKAPSLCEICARPDTQGHYAGELNDDDFIIKCSQECPDLKHPGPSLQMAAQQTSSIQGTLIPPICFFLFMAWLALKRFVIKKEALLAGYGEHDGQSDAHYVRVVV